MQWQVSDVATTFMTPTVILARASFCFSEQIIVPRFVLTRLLFTSSGKRLFGLPDITFGKKEICVC